MKKIQVAMITLMLALVMGISSLFGCSLVTTNSERDLNQVVATVKIYDGFEEEVITKRDVVSAYFNNYQGDTSEEYLDNIVDNLVSNKVIVQYAKHYFAGKLDISSNKSDITNYFTDAGNDYITKEDKVDAEYSAYKSANDYVDSFKEHDHAGDKVQDTYSGSVRAVPTGATNDDELTLPKKSAYITAGVKSADREDAFAKAIKSLKENHLADGYKNNDITTTAYFKDMLKAYYESKLVECLERDLIKDAREKITFDDVVAEYARLYAEQKALSDAEFETLLSSASASSPILTAKNANDKFRTGYGMVYHILLKVDDATTTELNKIKEDNKYSQSEIETKRAELFANQTFTDLRSSWITSGYDFDGTKFTGDYTLCEDNAYAFQGGITCIKAKDGDERAEYRVDDLTKFSIEKVVDVVKNYVYPNATFIPTENSKSITTYTIQGDYTVASDYEQRIKELIFAFSGDDSDSALNTYKGYAITPTSENSYMKEFAEAGKALVAGNSKNAFKVAITDYGYHIMFFSQNFDSTYDYDSLVKFMGKNETALEADLTTMLADWDNYEDKDNYMYILHGNLATSIANTALNNEQQKIVNEHISNPNSVKIYKDVYKDLIK